MRTILDTIYHIEILQEFSCTTLIGRLRKIEKDGHVSPCLDEKAVKLLGQYFFSGTQFRWKILWFRNESDGFGMYCAVGLELQIP